MCILNTYSSGRNEETTAEMFDFSGFAIYMCVIDYNKRFALFYADNMSSKFKVVHLFRAIIGGKSQLSEITQTIRSVFKPQISF